jgi:RNA polymerase sigma factor (sigma-70 family)
MSDLDYTPDSSIRTHGFEPGFQTEWGVVNSASQDTPDTPAALERLCRTYWYPLYAYVRRQGYDVPDA